MRIFRGVFWDPLLGDRVVWGETAEQVRERIAKIRQASSILDDGDDVVTELNIPTYKRGLLAWLNSHGVKLQEVVEPTL